MIPCAVCLPCRYPPQRQRRRPFPRQRRAPHARLQRLHPARMPRVVARRRPNPPRRRLHGPPPALRQQTSRALQLRIPPSRERPARAAPPIRAVRVATREQDVEPCERRRKDAPLPAHLLLLRHLHLRRQTPAHPRPQKVISPRRSPNPSRQRPQVTPRPPLAQPPTEAAALARASPMRLRPNMPLRTPSRALCRCSRMRCPAHWPARWRQSHQRQPRQSPRLPQATTPQGPAAQRSAAPPESATVTAPAPPLRSPRCLRKVSRPTRKPVPRPARQRRARPRPSRMPRRPSRRRRLHQPLPRDSLPPS